MKKKQIYQILWIIVGAILFGTMGLILFMSFAGNGCMIPDPDPTCQCFCCHMFGLRGYESCGNLGLLIGSLGGGIGVGIIYSLRQKKKKPNKVTL